MTNCQAMVMVIEFPNQLFRNKTWAIYDFVKFLSTVPQMPPYVYVYCINLCVVLCMYIHIIYIYIEANYTNGWNVWGERFLAVNHHNHKNLVPSILTHNLWLIFMGMKQKKIQNGRLKKTEFFNIAKSWAISAKISWIGPWVSRIDWCEGHQCDSTYMVVRLSDVSPKKG